MRALPADLGRLVIALLRMALPAITALAIMVAPLPAAAIGSFSPSVFQFVQTVRAGSTKQPGGWQEASAELKFVDTRHLVPRSWSCRLRVGMPLQTAANGRISPEHAAEATASVATEASGVVMHSRPEWLTAEFCVVFVAKMNELFVKDYPTLGARVNGP